MARFVFKLEAVLRQRQAEERRHQVVVAALENERRSIEELIRTYQRDLTHERQELRDQLNGERSGGTMLDLRGVRFQAGASLRLITLAQRAVLQLAGVHKKLDAARLALLQAATRRKAVEKLRETRHEEWSEEQKRIEESVADEISVMRAARREDLL